MWYVITWCFFFSSPVTTTFVCILPLIHIFFFLFVCLSIASRFYTTGHHCKNLYTNNTDRTEYIELSSDNTTNLLLEFYVIGSSDCQVHLSPVVKPNLNTSGVYQFREWKNNDKENRTSLFPSLSRPRSVHLFVFVLCFVIAKDRGKNVMLTLFFSIFRFVFRQLSFPVIQNKWIAVKHVKLLGAKKTDNFLLSESQPVQFRIIISPSEHKLR